MIICVLKHILYKEKFFHPTYRIPNSSLLFFTPSLRFAWSSTCLLIHTINISCSMELNRWTTGRSPLGSPGLVVPVVLVGHWVAGAGSSQNGLVLVVLASLVLFELVQLKVVVGKRRETTLKRSPWLHQLWASTREWGKLTWRKRKTENRKIPARVAWPRIFTLT